MMRYYEWTLEQWAIAAAWYAQRQPLPPATAEGMRVVRHAWLNLRVDEPGAVIELESGRKATLGDTRWAAAAMFHAASTQR
jgi:hypothetical protein